MIAADPRFRPWLEARLGTELAPDAQFMGVITEKIVAAAAFSHYTGHDIELSVAAEPGGGSKRFLSALFAYAFDQAGCARVTVRTRASNVRAIRLAKRIGFQQEGVLRDGFGNEDAIILGLTRKDYGKFSRKAASGS